MVEKEQIAVQKDRDKGWRKGEGTGTRGMALLEKAAGAKGQSYENGQLA